MRFPAPFVAVLSSLLLLVACQTGGSQARTPAPHSSATVATFRVSGTDGGSGVDITYGSQNANMQGGSKLPWSATMPVQGSARYYAVQAQLNGKGSITCSVRVDGVAKTAHASGGYDVCRAEVVNELGGRWAPSSAS